MYLLLILIPLFSSSVIGFFGRWLGFKGTYLISILSTLLTLILTLIGIYEIVLQHSECYIQMGPWITFDQFNIDWNFRFDVSTIVMCFVVSIISLIVQIYSVDYMKEDPHVQRFYMYLLLFSFFMLFLVASNNLVLLFFGWEGVGICSYLLISFWFTRIPANQSAIKAIILNKFGDVSLVIALFLIYKLTGTLNFNSLHVLVPYIFESSLNYSSYFSLSNLDLISILLLIACMGKSAQVGFHTWLPDAMEGPTPVSALIHAATMVTAGVFLLIRCSFFLEHSNLTLNLCLLFGSLTAFFSGTVACAQQDLKKIVAYSTCSQLGYMVAACGLTLFDISFFHLFNHAFFKALLFLCSGSIIHALSNEQDLRKMGGLLNYMPWTFVYMVVGSFSLIGFPFLTGFYSKDLIIETALGLSDDISVISGVFLLISVFLTSFYSFRLIYFVFLKKPLGFKKIYQDIKEPPLYINVSLGILAFSSLFIGFLTKDFFSGFGSLFFQSLDLLNPFRYNLPFGEFVDSTVGKLIFSFILLGLLSSYLITFFVKLNLTSVIRRTFYMRFYKNYIVFMNKKWFFDKIYNHFFVVKLLSFGYQFSYLTIDKGLLEKVGPSGLNSLIFEGLTSFLRFQKGLLKSYIFTMVLFLLFVTVLFLCF